MLIAYFFLVMLMMVSGSSCTDNPVESTDTAPVFTGKTTESFFLPMGDGVRLAVDLHLPKPLQSGTRVPTVVVMTRYWRSRADGEHEWLRWRLEAAASRGYAFVAVDERGTGASFGTWRYPWAPESVEDYAEIVSWIVNQNWSNGKVGAWGISYMGMTAQLLPLIQNPALRAVIPTFTQYDLYKDIAYPGGIYNDVYINKWNSGNREKDLNVVPGRSVRPVDADTAGVLLAQAIAEHAANGDVYEGFKNVLCRDITSPTLGVSLDDISAHIHKTELEQSNVAIYHWGSWMDHGGAQNVIDRFLTLSNPQQAMIGAWVHGGFIDASPFTPPGTPNPPESEQWDDMLDFFDRYLKEGKTVSTEKVLRYYTLAEEKWKSTNVWPVEGTSYEEWYFGAENSISTSTPIEPDVRDIYVVDFTTTTGNETRWDGDYLYTEDRREEDEKLLTYTSEVLSQDMEVTGQPVVTLYMTSTHADGAIYVYLEDVDPSGRVTYVTEGELRVLHRKVAVNPAPYEQLIPYHSFKVVDVQPLVPGEIAEITFGLMPTSILFKAGHRIRVAIAGHDANWFPRIPETGNPVNAVPYTRQT
jgi:putative CocE/NonD family hydrolase